MSNSECQLIPEKTRKKPMQYFRKIISKRLKERFQAQTTHFQKIILAIINTCSMLKIIFRSICGASR